MPSLAIDALGEAVEQRWLDQGHDVSAFAGIAAEELANSALLNQATPRDICAWFLGGGSIPEQSFRDFGQPAITLFKGHRFYVELLWWRESTTAIHQHSFAGAFAVLSGSSLHSRYRFEPTDTRTAELAFGRLSLDEAEVLQAGAVRPILPGDGLIHALFHLDHPTLSVVVRTDTIARHQPQLAYYRAGVGHDTRIEPEPFSTRLRLLDALGDTGDADFWHFATRMMLAADPWMALAILNVGYKYDAGGAAFAALVATARARIGDRVETLLACLKERERERQVIALRGSVRDPDQRFFLALLLNLPNRIAIDRAIAQRFPGENPEDRIVAWVDALGRDGGIGTHTDPLVAKVLRYALRGLPLSAVECEVTRVFGADALHESRLALGQIWDDLHANPVLTPLFDGLSQPARSRAA